MPAFTTNQWAIVALVFVLGWLLGLVSRSGGRRWKLAYERERDEHKADRRDLEARIGAANDHIAKLERRAPAAAVAPPIAAVPVASTAEPNDLTVIRGIGSDRAAALGEAGIRDFHALATLDAAGEVALERQLGLVSGTIAQEQWREQARLLHEGETVEWQRRFGQP